MNQVMLIGRLTKEPEVRYSSGNEPMAICRFTLAIDDGYGEKKKTNYPSVVVFGKTAENCEKYLSKGRQVAVVGKLQTGSYEKNGQKIYTTDVIAISVEFIGSSSNDTGSAEKTATSQNNGSQAHSGEQVSGFSALGEEDLPF